MTNPPQLPDSSRDALMYRVGYLQATADRTQATCERILAIVATGTKSTESKTVTSTAPIFGRMGEHMKRLWAATSTLSVWGKVAMWLAPRAVIMWGIAQGWLQAAWRLLREWLRVLF